MRKVVTINYIDIELTVKGYYEAPTERILYDSDMSGYPGDGPYFEAHEVYLSDSIINIAELLNDNQLNEIEELVLIELE